MSWSHTMALFQYKPTSVLDKSRAFIQLKLQWYLLLLNEEAHAYSHFPTKSSLPRVGMGNPYLFFKEWNNCTWVHFASLEKKKYTRSLFQFGGGCSKCSMAIAKPYLRHLNTIQVVSINDQAFVSGGVVVDWRLSVKLDLFLSKSRLTQKWWFSYVLQRSYKKSKVVYSACRDYYFTWRSRFSTL